MASDDHEETIVGYVEHAEPFITWPVLADTEMLAWIWHRAGVNSIHLVDPEGCIRRRFDLADGNELDLNTEEGRQTLNMAINEMLGGP